MYDSDWLKMTIDTAHIPATDLDALDEYARVSAGPELRDVLLALSTAARRGASLEVLDGDEALTPNQAAARLKMSRTHLYKLLDRGELPFDRVGRDRRIRASDLAAFAAQRECDRRELAERFANQQRTRAAAIEKLADLL
jgi:excisionase family DNA binding protein